MSDQINAAHCADVITRVRAARPLVQCITNYVSMDIAANVLLASGVSPAMVHAHAEVRDFVAISSALSVNIGTLSPAWVSGMKAAVEEANTRHVPWVFDPVGAGATSYRDLTSGELAAMSPAVIRANASEVLAVAAGVRATGGVDATHGSEDALDAAQMLATRLSTVVAVTGAVDYITDGTRTVEVRNGHAMMTLVTAVGCSATALVAACCAVESDRVLAATAALTFLGLAGERAAEGNPGPGTFRVRLIDALHAITPDDLAAGAQVRVA